MHKLVRFAPIALALLSACELQPGPPRATPGPVQAPPAPVPAPADAGPAQPVAPKPVVQITPQCLEVATHIATVLIASADPAQRTIFESERDRIVRSSGEVCTTQNWSDAASKCYLAASTQPTLKACEVKFPPPVQPMPSPPPPQTRDLDPRINGTRVEPGTPGTGATLPRADAQPRPGAGTGLAAQPRPGAGTGSAAPRPTPAPGAAAQPRPGAGTGSAAQPRPGAGTGSAAQPRPTPAPGAAAQPRPGAGTGSATQPRPSGGTLMPPRAGSGSGR